MSVNVDTDRFDNSKLKVGVMVLCISSNAGDEAMPILVSLKNIVEAVRLSFGLSKEYVIGKLAIAIHDKEGAHDAETIVKNKSGEVIVMSKG